MQIRTVARPLNVERNGAFLGEFERIGKKILKNLLDALAVGMQALGKVVADAHVKGQAFLFGDRRKLFVHVLGDAGKLGVLGHYRNLARFDFRQVENVIDEGQELHATTVDDARLFYLLCREISLLIVRKAARQDEQAVERCT